VTESLAWTCSHCGYWCWNHHAACSKCGTSKPTPPAEEPPSDVAQAEPPWRMAVPVIVTDWDAAPSIEALLHAARRAALVWELRRRIIEALADDNGTYAR
jgi:hypothetical protein